MRRGGNLCEFLLFSQGRSGTEASTVKNGMVVSVSASIEVIMFFWISFEEAKMTAHLLISVELQKTHK